jgi:hypothetical protein
MKQRSLVAKGETQDQKRKGEEERSRRRKKKLKFQPFLVVVCLGGTLKMSNFKVLSIFSGSRTPI